MIPIYARFQNSGACDSSAPRNLAESAALRDIKLRTAQGCPNSTCKFVIKSQTDGSILIEVEYVERRLLFEGCVVTRADSHKFVFDRGGNFIRTEWGPYS